MENYNLYEQFESHNSQSDIGCLNRLENICKREETQILESKECNLNVNVYTKKRKLIEKPTYGIEANFEFSGDLLKPIYDQLIYQRMIHLLSSYLKENGVYAQPIYKVFINKANEFFIMPDTLSLVPDRTVFLGSGRCIFVNDSCNFNYYSGQYDKLNKNILTSELNKIKNVHLASNELIQDIKSSMILPIGAPDCDRFKGPNRKISEGKLDFLMDLDKTNFNKKATLKNWINIRDSFKQKQDN